jgi:2-hydroxychromene-2-carboxylate isomerase
VSAATSVRVDFFFDLVCPYAYLAHLRIERLCAAKGAQLIHRPVLLGGIFRAIGTADVPMTAMPEAKRRLVALDLERWSRKHGMPLRFPAGHPRRTVLAMRATLAAGEDDIPAAARALYAAYWREGLDLEDPVVVRRALDQADLDGGALVKAASADAMKEALRAATDEAVAAGVFGVPSFLVHGPSGAQLFWGQDRLGFVERAIDGWFVEAPAPTAGVAP